MTVTRRRALAPDGATSTAATSIVVTLADPADAADVVAAAIEALAPATPHEVLVVSSSSATRQGGQASPVSRIRERCPDIAIRMIAGAGLDLAQARRIGVQSASGSQVLLTSGAGAVCVDRAVVPAGTGRLTGADMAPHLQVEGVLVPIATALNLDFTATSGDEDPGAWAAAHAAEEFELVLLEDREPAVPGTLDTILANLRTLEGNAGTDPRSQAMVDALTRDQALRLNAWLRSHPERRTELVDRVAALNLKNLDWSVVNEGLARDLAILYLFPPALDTSGLVAAKRLRERGLVTDVITHDLSSLRSIDPDSLRVPGPTLGRVHRMPGRASFAGWGHISDFAAQAWESMREWEGDQAEYRSLYSRAMPPAAHYAAALVKVRRPGMHWVAEFSDPLDLNPLGQHRTGPVKDDWLMVELREALQERGVAVEDDLRLFEWCERVTFALADEIIFTNGNQRDLMLDHCTDTSLAERARAISHVSAHPVLPPEFYDFADVELERRPGTIELGYFGVFYATRDLGDVASAMLRLTQRERDRLRLHVYTTDPDALSIKLAGLGLGGTIVAHAYRPFHEFLALTKDLDVLIVDDARTREHHDVNPYLPSKLADYRGSGTDIWAICEPGSIMSGQEFAHRSDLGDVDQAVRVLRSLIQRER